MKEKHDGRQQKATLSKELLLKVWEQVEKMRKEISKTQVEGRSENLCDRINIYISLIYRHSYKSLFIAKILFSVHFMPPYQKLCLP